MPTLEWIGKDKVVNHHLDVPYRVLDRIYSYDEAGQHTEDNGSENMIIHGDNLEALKALLPRYEGRIKCIYIDPPYNTGNEGWVYNDNVNDPRIKAWLNKVVGKEGEDLSRHDKWLCMMYPRLKLLQRLLADDGVIFISIDDNEQANLRMLCNEVFGKQNFIAQIVWQKRTSPDARKRISNGHEYILVYAKMLNNLEDILNLIEIDYSDADKYKNPDHDPKGPWVSVDFTAQGFRPNQMYEIRTPSGRTIVPPEGRCWKNLKEVFDQYYAEGRLWFGSDGNGVPRQKNYLSEKGGKTVWTWWTNEEVGHTQEATQQLAVILQKKVFDYPKPVRLIQRIIQMTSAPDSIILDSFAGSATTAHAVLNMNKADGGNRRFILVEMMDYSDSITAERVKRVIKGYSSADDVEETVYDAELTISNLKNGAALLDEAKQAAKDAKGKYDKVGKPKIIDGHLRVIGTYKSTEEIEGTGGSFSYYELGEPLMHGDVLNEDVGVEKIREYVYFTETKNRLPDPHPDEPYFMGVHVNSAYYFYYERDSVTTLNRAFLHSVKTKADAYVIYADLCMLSEAELEQYHITFKKIPRDITKL